MKRAWLLAVALSFCAAACGLTTPDGGDLERLVGAIEKLPDGAKRVIARYAANRYAANKLSKDGKVKSVHIGRYDCYKKGNSWNGKEKPEVIFGGVKAEDVFDCLEFDWSRTFVECVDALHSQVEWMWKLYLLNQNPDHKGGFCDEEFKYSMFFDPEKDPALNPEYITPNDIARSFIAAQKAPPPEVLAALGTAVGMFGRTGFLCPLADWGCPDSPGSMGPNQGDR
jgi:hypothetical protein